MDAVFELTDLAEKVCTEASKFEQDGEFDDAYVSAMESLNLLFQAISLCDDEDLGTFKSKLKDRVKGHGRWCEQLRQIAFGNQNKGENEPMAQEELENCHPREREHRLLLQSLEKRISKSTEGPGFSQVIGLRHLKKLLNTSVIIQTSDSWRREFEKRGMPIDRRHFLLFGVPGTGKSLIVKSYHQEATGTNMLELSMSDILSRYIGDGEAALNTAFEVAEKHSPCILFLDEIDGVFGVGDRRGLNSSLITQFLTLSEKCKGAQIFAATNKPWELEPSFRRRFRFLVHVPLPNFPERMEILRINIEKGGYHLPMKHIGAAAKATCRLSSNDLEKLVLEAIEDAWHPVFDAKYFKEVKKGTKAMWQPCDDTDLERVQMVYSQIAADEIYTPELSIEHLERAMWKVKKTTVPAVGSEPTLLQKTLDFAQDHAVCGRNGKVEKSPEYCDKYPWESHECRFMSGKVEKISKVPAFMLDEIGVQTEVCIPMNGVAAPRRTNWDILYDIFAAAMSCFICEHPLLSD